MAGLKAVHQKRREQRIERKAARREQRAEKKTERRDARMAAFKAWRQNRGLTSVAANPNASPSNTAIETTPVSQQTAPMTASTTNLPAPSSTNSSGYNPDAVSQMFPTDDYGNSLTPNATDTTDTSDSIMRNKLLYVKQTNPDYYAFIADQLQSTGINTTLEGMGEGTTVAAPSWADTFKQVLTPAIQTWGQYLNAKVTNKQMTQEEANKQMLNAQASNAYLVGDTGNTKMMYLFGGLALLAIAWFLLRKKR